MSLFGHCRWSKYLPAVAGKTTIFKPGIYVAMRPKLGGLSSSSKLPLWDACITGHPASKDPLVDPIYWVNFSIHPSNPESDPDSANGSRVGRRSRSNRLLTLRFRSPSSHLTDSKRRHRSQLPHGALKPQCRAASLKIEVS